MGAGVAAFLPIIIGGAIDTAKLIATSGGPDTPGVPKLRKLPVQKAKKHLEDYEAKRMQASIDQWKQKFPDLYKGGQYEIDDIAKQQQGFLGGNIADDMARSGLGPIKAEGTNQYKLSQDLGLSPITLSQRTSQAVTRQIAQNPEWTNKISGGTLATMLANNYQNQNAYTQFLGANQAAQYAAKQAMGGFNTQALLGGLASAATLGAQRLGQEQFGPLSPTGQGMYQGAAMQQPPMQQPPVGSPSYNNSFWGMPAYQPTGLGGSFSSAQNQNPYSNYGNYYNNEMYGPGGAFLPPASNIYGSGYDFYHSGLTGIPGI